MNTDEKRIAVLKNADRRDAGRYRKLRARELKGYLVYQCPTVEEYDAAVDALPEPEETSDTAHLSCPDCAKCKRHAYSDATTPGFFYDRCEKHRRPERDA